ncbi:conserved Plasmodium protein, unknown function [Plasmodium sp. gorilla clade G2]|uniref:conserved Plasmodium protein, unknown function n=1 Tax=Plasmodium sp. gorilla clade G2 TaxID=880535 RepID=UPI000D22708E|nr:conserved Plasmodium protein, unknown function [Plasmodium sp. gorilla clade G2]SOV16922.1 conserved Plasmodium protein, unknown function [Plasmodium sp. gorilla clade G2]
MKKKKKKIKKTNEEHYVKDGNSKLKRKKIKKLQKKKKKDKKENIVYNNKNSFLKNNIIKKKKLKNKKNIRHNNNNDEEIEEKKKEKKKCNYNYLQNINNKKGGIKYYVSHNIERERNYEDINNTYVKENIEINKMNNEDDINKMNNVNDINKMNNFDNINNFNVIQHFRDKNEVIINKGHWKNELFKNRKFQNNISYKNNSRYYNNIKENNIINNNNNNNIHDYFNDCKKIKRLWNTDIFKTNKKRNIKYTSLFKNNYNTSIYEKCSNKNFKKDIMSYIEEMKNIYIPTNGELIKVVDEIKNKYNKIYCNDNNINCNDNNIYCNDNNINCNDNNIYCNDNNINCNNNTYCNNNMCYNHTCDNIKKAKQNERNILDIIQSEYINNAFLELYYNLGKDIIYLIHVMKPTIYEIYMRRSILYNLQLFLKEIYTDYCMIIFGSCNNDIDIYNSDIDICIYNTIQSDIINIRKLYKNMLYHPLFENVNIKKIIHAKVPIIKCFFNYTKLSVDISFNQISALTSSIQTQRYIQKYPLMKYVLIFLKMFLYQHDLNDASKGGISSFNILLLLSQFLNSQRFIFYDLHKDTNMETANNNNNSSSGICSSGICSSSRCSSSRCSSSRCSSGRCSSSRCSSSRCSSGSSSCCCSNDNHRDSNNQCDLINNEILFIGEVVYKFICSYGLLKDKNKLIYFLQNYYHTSNLLNHISFFSTNKSSQHFYAHMNDSATLFHDIFCRMQIINPIEKENVSRISFDKIIKIRLSFKQASFSMINIILNYINKYFLNYSEILKNHTHSYYKMFNSYIHFLSLLNLLGDNLINNNLNNYYKLLFNNVNPLLKILNDNEEQMEQINIDCQINQHKHITHHNNDNQTDKQINHINISCQKLEYIYTQPNLYNNSFIETSIEQQHIPINNVTSKDNHLYNNQIQTIQPHFENQEIKHTHIKYLQQLENHAQLKEINSDNNNTYEQNIINKNKNKDIYTNDNMEINMESDLSNLNNKIKIQENYDNNDNNNNHNSDIPLDIKKIKLCHAKLLKQLHTYIKKHDLQIFKNKIKKIFKSFDNNIKNKPNELVQNICQQLTTLNHIIDVHDILSKRFYYYYIYNDTFKELKHDVLLQNDNNLIHKQKKEMLKKLIKMKNYYAYNLLDLDINTNVFVQTDVQQ